MKKSILSLFIGSIFIYSCSTSVSVTPNASSSPSAASSTAATPAPSQNPQASATPVTPTPKPTATAAGNSTPIACNTATYSVGQQLKGSEFFSLSCPAVKVGTKWTYTALNAEVSVEIIAKNNDGTYTSRTTTTSGPAKEFTSTSPNGSSESADNMTITYEGTESVTVPAGTYTAFKGTTTRTDSGATTKLSFWMDKSVGTVKVKSETSVSGFNVNVDTVLKEFKN
jgi:hypothetical protein